MAKYRKKPVVVEAVQFVPESKSQLANALRFCPQMGVLPDRSGIIPTEEGKMVASSGDWIIKGVNGEFYPCKPDIFHKTYELVTHDDTKDLPPKRYRRGVVDANH